MFCGIPVKDPVCKSLEFEKEKDAESLLNKIMADNFPKLRRDVDQVHEANRSPNTLNGINTKTQNNETDKSKRQRKT